MSMDRYDQLMATYDTFVEEARRTRIQPCSFAQAFLVWVDEHLLRRLGDDPPPSDIAAAKLELAEKYFEWFQKAPRSHQVAVPAEDEHVCILEVFQAGYLYLSQLALNSRYVATPPTVTPRRRISHQILKARGQSIEIEES